VEHLRAYHSKSQLNTKAVIVSPNWPKFKAVTKELKLIQKLPKGEKVFMMTTSTSTYEPPDIIIFAWAINYWLIDANTHVFLPLMNTIVSTLKPDIVTTHLEANAAIEAANKYLLTAIVMVVMDSYEAEALMRFNATIVFNGLPAKADTLIETIVSLNFVSKEFVIANGFYKDCKTKLAKRKGNIAHQGWQSWIYFIGPHPRPSPKEHHYLHHFLLLMGTTSLIFNLEFFLALKVQILYWDFQI
jgi:hypothetical protein